MSKALPPPGTYSARLNGAMVVYESDGGALLVHVPYALVHPDTNYTGRHMEVIGKKDGTLKQKSIDVLKKIFGWDGINPFDLEAIEPNEDGSAQFELADCFHDDSYVPPGESEPRIQFKAQWLNEIGGSQGMPTALDDAAKKAVLTKWSSKFKAVSASTGGKAAKPAPAKPAAAPAPAKPAPKAAASAPPSRGKVGSPAVGGHARTSSLEETWDALVKARPDVAEDAVAEEYYKAQDAVREGANSELTPSEWGQVLDKLGL